MSLLPLVSSRFAGTNDAVLRRRRTPHHSGCREFRELLVYGYPVVVECRRLQYYTGCPDQYGQSKDPQEQPVQHHSYVFPVFFHLVTRQLCPWYNYFHCVSTHSKLHGYFLKKLDTILVKSITQHLKY